MCEDKVERCVLCHNPLEENDVTMPRMEVMGGGVAHIECIEDSAPKEYLAKIA